MQGKLDEAEPLYLRAVHGFEREFGSEHTNTLASMNNLARLLRARGRLGEAEQLYRLVLEVRENLLGVDHPDTVRSASHLAAFFRAQGKLREAEPFYNHALKNCRGACASPPVARDDWPRPSVLRRSLEGYGDEPPIFTPSC